MDVASQLKRGISRQFSTGSLRKSGKLSFGRQNSMDPRRNNFRFSFGRQSSLDPIRRNMLVDDGSEEGLTVPDNLDSTMQLLFSACQGHVEGVQDLLDEGIDVNSIDLDGRTALHIAACEGHVEVVKLLLSRGANMDARDRWGSTAAADAKYYGNIAVYNILKARGAKVPKTRKTPMTVANPREVPEYELNPLDIQIRRSDGISKGSYQVARWNGTKVNVFRHELTLLEKVRHPNVVQFIGAVTQNVPMMIVLEYHSRGDLASYLHKKGRFSPSKALRFALEIARNILLDFGGQLKVAGFGVIRLSMTAPGKVKLVEPEAIDRSSFYVAPEIYKDEVFDRSVDVHSFGVMLYEMMEGSPPFSSKPPHEAAKLICLEEKRPTIKSKSKSFPSEVKDLMEECWHPDPSARPTFSEIIVRLDKIVTNCSKHGWWKDTFKLPWYTRAILFPFLIIQLALCRISFASNLVVLLLLLQMMDYSPHRK
ncbi:UNVERIFIED_CONTAM: Integrin-linked protein kinase [Sesamum radiatum]|uniref:Integrin-linked protein kinase n=1 Tax=Sesamum radiatum TaxID=300843 RepID=A0AAW2SJ45_SESRA